MDRRGFIRGIAGLAALSVAPWVKPEEIDTGMRVFLKEARTGLVYRKTFYIEGPVRLVKLRDLVIDSCLFYQTGIGAHREHPYRVVITDCHNVSMMNCIFTDYRGVKL